VPSPDRVAERGPGTRNDLSGKAEGDEHRLGARAAARGLRQRLRSCSRFRENYGDYGDYGDYGVQAGVVVQAAQVVAVDVTFVQIWTPGAPLPAIVHSRTSCWMHGQPGLVVLSL
jgi:hypothetical protein